LSLSLFYSAYHTKCLQVPLASLTFICSNFRCRATCF
jgi:hypothetical protein